MEFIDFQAEVDDSESNNLELYFVENDEDKNFVDDSQEDRIISLNFYRKFHNQSREIHAALNDRSNNNCKLGTRDLQSEMYWEIDRGFVEFDKFDGYEKAAEKFKKSLYTFDTSSGPKDSFYNTILFGLIFKLFKNSVINKETIEKLLGNEFFDDFQQIKRTFCSLTYPFVIF